MSRKELSLLIYMLFAGVFMAPSQSEAREDFSRISIPFVLDNTKTISMDFKDAQLNDVLKIFSQQSGLNFIASTDVAQRRINLYLDKVPVETALERILYTNGLTYELEPGNNIFVVKTLQAPPKNVITRVYPLKNATVASSALNSTLASAGASGGGASAGIPGLPGSSASTSSSASGNIVKILQSIMTPDGSISEDPRTNSIIVTDIPNQFPLIEQTISRLDVRIPQVLIEVEMLDVSKGTADLLGAKFGNSPVTFHGAERDDAYPFSLDNIADDVNGSPYTVFEDERFRVSTLSFTGLTFTLQFLRTRTDTKNLARPRIITLNNQMAEIKIVTNEAIGISSTTSALSDSTVSEAERTETGVTLKVTPQVNLLTNEITMAIEPKVKEARRGGTFGSQTFKDPEERGSKSIVRILDGDTIIIGGLLRNDNSETKTQVPVLSKIPLMGAAFRHKDKSETQRELIIFISPHIIRDNMTSARASNSKTFDREQDIPENRLSEINKELSNIENKGF